MDFTFRVENTRDAVLARAALDGLLAAAMRQEPVHSRPIEEHISDVVDLPVAVANTPVTTFEPTVQQAGFSKEQIKAAAAQNPELAAIVAKKGRKSVAETTRIMELTAQVLGDQPEPVGAALNGSTAEELRAALAATTTQVSAEPGVVVCELPATTTTGIEQPKSGLAALDPDVASIAAAASKPQAEPEPEPAKDDISSLSDSDLYERIQNYANGAGLFWFKNVVDQGGGNINKMPRDHMIKVLGNPEAFYPEGHG